MRTTKPTLRPLLASLQTCLWAVLVLCLGTAWGMRTVDPLDLPKAERQILSESAEDQRVYFNARWYSPERGAFGGRDAALQFWTPYSYVGNAPLTGFDPDGRQDYSSMTGMDFGGMADFAFGQSTGSSGNQLALQVNSSLTDFASMAPELPGKGASYAAYGAFGLGTLAMGSAAFPLTAPASPFLLAGADALATSSLALSYTQATIHGAQYMGGNADAGGKLIGDAVGIATGKIAGNYGARLFGTEPGFTSTQNALFQQWGNTGAGALQTAWWDALSVNAASSGVLPSRVFSPALIDASYVAQKVGH